MFLLHCTSVAMLWEQSQTTSLGMRHCCLHKLILSWQRLSKYRQVGSLTVDKPKVVHFYFCIFYCEPTFDCKMKEEVCISSFCRDLVQFQDQRGHTYIEKTVIWQLLGNTIRPDILILHKVEARTVCKTAATGRLLDTPMETLPGSPSLSLGLTPFFLVIYFKSGWTSLQHINVILTEFFTGLKCARSSYQASVFF